ncbi:hypothetical protein [Massilia yuzhufengensis]|uniref:Uncharacterized protein n=1 Tax=Massilia yuzhufengensis TaxID=1164594 RepID=A0A1I1L0F9_9BURK|nr:hypothetical protein [Massilia yuzhufengensis]SFC66524.1 hypothetical protein SAMN05216204_108165 [Massilia yuzhufengensis]
MASKTLLAARREALVERCADQRAELAYEVAMLGSPEVLGVIPSYATRHGKTVMVAAGVAAGLFLVRPKWAVATATAAVSLYSFAQKILPLLRWKGFEIH